MKIAIVFDDCMRLGGVERVINNLADYFSDNFNYTIEVINYNMNSKKQNFIYNSAVKITDLTIKNTKKDFISKVYLEDFKINNINAFMYIFK